MGSGAKRVRAALCREHAAEGKPRRDALCERDRVRLDAVLLEAEERARSADAGLHLVDEQQNIAGLAEARNLLHKRLIERQHAAFALDELHQHRADGAAHTAGLYAGDVVRLRVDKPFRKREKEIVKHILPRRGEGGNRPPVEGVVQRHDRVSACAVFVKGIFPREFDRALVRLRAGVAEKHALHAGALDERLGDGSRGFGVEKVRDVRELFCLRRDGSQPAFVAAAEGANADSACKIEIRLAVKIL
ncbi:hypothetical protein SDC9_151272 [bioreactor metagenome]|uniref:Uncharacterized protein n=1 Tax=bioreactor metagenome TaxID=1076179 RepID=A0A645ERF3_9ZZZZ